MIGELRGRREVIAWAIILGIFLILGLYSGKDEIVARCTQFLSMLAEICRN